MIFYIQTCTASTFQAKMPEKNLNMKTVKQVCAQTSSESHGLQDDEGEHQKATTNEAAATPAAACGCEQQGLASVGGERLTVSNKNKQKRKREFIYGNYDRYYGYRFDHNLSEDPRLKFFSRDWVEGKDCLDIGCNEGVVTISLAQKFACGSMVGVDIDPKLIHRARENLRRKVEDMQDERFRGSLRMEQSAEQSDLQALDRGDEGFGFRANDHKSKEVSRRESLDDGLTAEKLLEQVEFRTQNYLETYVKKATYDTVICLSVTKWIQLNWGDEGLIKLFSKIWQELRPGGMLVLEPQPWTSYEKKRRVSEVAKKHFNESVIRPEDFPNVLTEKIGFKSWQEISSAVPHSTTAFSRPLFLYHK
ncbi:hypothetical protein O6H91_17G054800 [Diphasiastrum complanatum]|uniref:Uncharacterized protein n=1 Tax=Diphasiastrum complanatum TaxID=34168 RepID=A0ACC2B703_DIPCM|nr:hypothetical protein O6H91_17G054800 [Diphasiastrum complanatum]